MLPEEHVSSWLENKAAFPDTKAIERFIETFLKNTNKPLCGQMYATP